MKALKPNHSFLRLPVEYSSYDKSKVVIFSVPYEGTVSYGKGTSFGPKAIIDASHELELYDDELKTEIYQVGISTLEPIKAEATSEKMQESIYQCSKQIIKDKKFMVMLGGEHSITPGYVKALSEKYKNISILQIDAHSDLRDSFRGSILSHACAMARTQEFGKIVQVGIRSTGDDEVKAVEKNKENIFWARDIYNHEGWIDSAVSKLSENVFITIDVDGFDPSIMPSTGTPEPGGLLWYQVIHLLRKVFREKNVIGFDIVELAPIKGLHAPDFMCAKLLYRLIGYWNENQKN